MIWTWAIIGLLALERLAEVIHSEFNTRKLLARGAHEEGLAHYPLIVALHIAWLVAIVVFLPNPATIHWIPLLALIVCQILRGWVIATLGPYWTTRIITLPGAPLVTGGPSRFTRPPTYWVVGVEIAALPLTFGEIWVAAVFSVLNAIVITLRMRTEDAALAPRRTG